MSDDPDAGSLEPRARGGWLPLLVGALLLVLALLLWRLLDSQERADLLAKVGAQGDYLARSIEADLRNRIPSLQRMTRTWELRQGTPRSEFSSEAQSYIADVPGFQAIEWVDRDSVVRYVVPLEGNERAVGLNLGFEPSRKLALARARDSGSPQITSPVDLVQGGKGFLAFFPIFDRGSYDGAILAVFRISEWLDYVLGDRDPRSLAADYRLEVSFDSTPVYVQEGWDGLARNDLGLVSTARLLDHSLHLRLRPTDAFLAANRSYLPLVVGGFGALLSLLIAFIVGLFQRSHAEAWRAHAARRSLEAEIRERRKVDLALRRAFVRLDLATKAARMGIWSWDLKTDELVWNERMYELYDLPPDVEPVYETWTKALHEEDRGRVELLLLDAVAGKAVFDTEFRILVPGGAVRSLRSAARVERDAEGKPVFVTGLNWDISETKAFEAALRESERQVRLLLNSTGEAIYGIDREGRCTFANPSCARILGLPDPSLLLGRDMHALIHGRRADGTPLPLSECLIHRAFREGLPVHIDNEVFWRQDGSSFPVEYWSYPQIEGDAVLGAVVAFVDITERLRSEERIRHMATHDALTDLPGLRLLKDRLGMALGAARRTGSPLALLFLDLDGFKAANDSYGHDAGDEVLRVVARRLAAGLRATDTVARMGGDEFLLVLTEVQGPEALAPLVRKLLELVREPIPWNGVSIRVGASIGAALSSGRGDDVESLIKRADEAMYEVKKSGKDGFALAPDRLGSSPPSALGWNN